MSEASMDLQARQTAVDVRQSVIVQAPAGSGKTTLLVERLLGLLAVVDEPEQILAMTFTRKAAAEMRQRVLKYLEMDTPPEGEHEQTAWEKARVVAGKVQAWGLLNNPSRLKIQTIDSFCAALVRQMPVLSRLGPVPGLTENATAHYRLAARRTLETMSEDVKTLLHWRDNNFRALEDLIANLLPKREQWLRVLGADGAPDRKILERSVRALMDDELELACAHLTRGLFATGLTPAGFWELVRFGAAHLPEKNAGAELGRCLAYQTMPAPEVDALEAWKGLAWLLLVKDKAQLRKQVRVSEGFPAKTDEKEAVMALLGTLSEACAQAFHRVRQLPSPGYPEDQWQALAALVRVLQHAARELEVVFAEAGQMDFSGVAAAAQRALGDTQAPTDLGLYTDYRISHILVDEFQDTNWNQYYLLEKLTAGWSPDDGRTLFLVGDPMQSIYRFREAEVGLFVQVREQGLGDIQLTSVRLTDNFRSRPEIVDWVNQAVGQAFPQIDDAAMGQIRYAASTARRNPGGAISRQLGVNRDRQTEAAELVELIGDALDRTDHSIAVLVRARTHLEQLLPELKRAGIAYRAQALDKLVDRPVVQDLIALTRAIWHPADRASALAVLRAPWCGLTLVDLLTLIEGARDQTIESLLEDEVRLAALSQPARERAQRVAQVLTRARALWRKRPLAELVEGAWTALGGPDLCAHDTDRDDASGYLRRLSEFEQAGDIVDWLAFEEYLADQRAAGSADARVELLTIHQAKGLEWDMVIIPSLERTTGGGDAPMLRWFNRPSGDGEQLLIAPLRAAWEATDGALIRTIKTNQQLLADAERQRLLYVATTRAKERLVICASVKRKQDKLTAPAKDSLLADLWPALETKFASSQPGTRDAAPVQHPLYDQRLRRVRADWQPACPEPLAWTSDWALGEKSSPPPYDWAGIGARRIGSVIHRVLEYIGRYGVEAMDDDTLRHLKQRIPVLLRTAGLGPEQLESAVAVVADALDRTLADEKGRWILSARHTDPACELPIGGLIEGRLFHGVVDRTFIDAGTRWIIDYKSGRHEGGRLDAFLDAESQRHAQQLRNYQTIFRQMGQTRVRTALYFPGLGEFREIVT